MTVLDTLATVGAAGTHAWYRRRVVGFPRLSTQRQSGDAWVAIGIVASLVFRSSSSRKFPSTAAD